MECSGWCCCCDPTTVVVIGPNTTTNGVMSMSSCDGSTINDIEERLSVEYRFNVPSVGSGFVCIIIYWILVVPYFFKWMCRSGITVGAGLSLLLRRVLILIPPLREYKETFWCWVLVLRLAAQHHHKYHTSTLTCTPVLRWIHCGIDRSSLGLSLHQRFSIIIYNGGLRMVCTDITSVGTGSEIQCHGL